MAIFLIHWVLLVIIALDYDGTYTADPQLWLDFVNHAKSNGHTVHVVTMRYPQEAIIDSELLSLVEVYYTSRKAKKKFMRMLGIIPTIWIDDNPEWLFEDSK